MLGATGMAKRRHREPVDVQERARPTPERLRHASGDWDRGDTGQITLRDAPLERAWGRGVITAEQYAAGMKFRHHWWHAGLGEAIGSVDLNRILASDVTSFSGMAKTEAQVFHRQQYRAAVKATGTIGAKVLDAIICQEAPLEQVGYALGWGSMPQAISAAAERLKMALDRLNDLWR